MLLYMCIYDYIYNIYGDIIYIYNITQLSSRCSKYQNAFTLNDCDSLEASRRRDRGKAGKDAKEDAKDGKDGKETKESWLMASVRLLTLESSCC